MSKMVLPKKYLDFLDIFNKAQANILPKHNQHNLALKLKPDKQIFFYLIYDFFKLELNVLCEYINEILAKDFIIPFKLFLEAFVFFTNKKNKSLRLCINYRGLNIITKKTNIYFN